MIYDHLPSTMNPIGEDIVIEDASDIAPLPCDVCGERWDAHVGINYVLDEVAKLPTRDDADSESRDYWNQVLREQASKLDEN